MFLAWWYFPYTQSIIYGWYQLPLKIYWLLLWFSMIALCWSIGYAKLYFLNSFAKKNKIFATLNIIFNVSKLCAVFKSFLWILDVDVLRIILWKKHYPLKTMHLSTSSFTKYCFHSRFCTSIVFSNYYTNAIIKV